MLAYIVWMLIIHPISGVENITWPLSQAVDIPGQIILGALMMVHEREDLKTCGPIMPQGGIQALECMLFALDRVNQDPRLLPGISLGAYVLDDCDKDTYGLEQAVEFIKGSLTNIGGRHGTGHCPGGTDKSRIVSGVLGAASSVTSIQVANLLRLFKIPQVSFFSTSPELSNKQRFEYFLRTVPSDTNQAQAMVELIRRLGWSYVSVLFEESNYGIKAFTVIEQLLSLHNICIAVKERLLKDSGVAGEDVYDIIVARLTAHPRARGVIVFGSDQEVAGVMRAVRRSNATGRFSWIGSDGWSARTLVFAGHEAQVEGTLSLQPRAKPVPGFFEHFRSLHPSSNTRNPWFPEYWERYFGCRWPGYPATPYNARLTRPCSGLETYGPEFEMERQLQFVADAVMAFAHALHAMHADRCGGVPGLCLSMSPVHGPTLLRYLKNVSFRGYSDDEDFRFSPSGDGPVRYNILHFKQTRPRFYEWIQVGEFRDGRLELDLGKVQFRPGQPALPESRCSEPCGPGQAKQVLSEAEACCWRCVACGRYQILRGGTRCDDCGPGTLPDGAHSRCLPLNPYHMRPDSPWAVGAMAFSTIGICFTLAVILVFWRYSDTPVVRASGRELSYVLLGGILMCYGVTFLLVQKPTDFICGVQKCTLGLGFAVIYAALWTKTNRIARIFRAGARRRPGFISPKSQLFICGSLVSVQLSVTAVWLAYVPPRAVKKFPSREMAVLVCSESLDGSSYAVAFAYPGVLIAICTAYAVLTRNTPEAFNESKYIGFSMYTTCVIWLAFVPIYVTTARQAVLNLTAMAVAISLSASVTLVCLFAPKVYVILARPERNVRKALVLQTKTYTPSPANLTTVSVPLEPSTQSDSYVVVYERNCEGHPYKRFNCISTQTDDT